MADWLTMFESQLEVKPPLSDQQLLAIPAKRGVLLLLAGAGQPILLLTAADIRGRLRSRLREPADDRRRKAADLRAITGRILWKLSTSHFETDLNYLELARAIWPSTYAKLLAWGPAWFVHIDPAEPYPHFARTREALLRPGRYVGPFESGASAERFIEVIEDAFDLCRDYQCLRQSPSGPPCAYFQMGRCVGPCNGTISMDQYRGLAARAADFAAGRRQPLRDELAAKMKAAAGRLQFEQADVLKTRLARLEEFDKPAYRWVAPVEDFRFLIFLGAGRQRLDVFLVRQGTIIKGPQLKYPPPEAAIEALRDMMAAPDALPSATPSTPRLSSLRSEHSGSKTGQASSLRSAFGSEAQARREHSGSKTGQAQPADQAPQHAMGLVAHYLLGGRQRLGLVLRYRHDLTASQIARALADAAQSLGLSPPPAPPAEAQP